MRRGFKTEALELAAEIRAELDLTPFEPLDPWALAAHLDIPVWALSSYREDIPQAATHLLIDDTAAFSAMLACDGLRRVIIYNDGHAVTRQRADICHELAHALLLHRPHPAFRGEPPRFDDEQEEEARWLGGVLQVSDEFCLLCCRESLTSAEAALRIGVSQQLMQWRLNMSGAHRRVTRARARLR
jgi:Zn-dependent peptidase ImmA (M78 family)